LVGVLGFVFTSLLIWSSFITANQRAPSKISAILEDGAAIPFFLRSQVNLDPAVAKTTDERHRKCEDLAQMK
jgi:hypothetical protein